MNEEAFQKIILALDLPDLKSAEFILDELKGLLRMVKIGSASFYRLGDSLLNLLKQRELDVFIDFKFHDIPNTVAAAAESIVPWGIRMFTVHLAGGRKMLQATVQRVQEISSKLRMMRPMVIGISVLTSIDEETLHEDLKISVRLTDLVSNLARPAKESGLDGIVASGHEIELIRQVVGNDLKIICPGIRAYDEARSDQRRTLTVREAFRKGADFVVIGRPIYESSRPREVYQKIVNGIDGPVE